MGQDTDRKSFHTVQTKTLCVVAGHGLSGSHAPAQLVQDLEVLHMQNLRMQETLAQVGDCEARQEQTKSIGQPSLDRIPFFDGTEKKNFADFDSR